MKKTLLLLSISCYGYASYSQDTRINGFCNVNAMAIKDNAVIPNKTVNNYFSLGQYDLFVTSQLTDRISALGETVFEYNPTTQHFGIDVERAIVNYAVNNYFNISVGKFHIPLGYWNNAYHHGMVLQPTITRPDAIKFEDEGGLLPIHDIGLQVSGDNLGKLNFGYNLMVGNGIASTADGDDNTSKSIIANVHIAPVQGLKLIASSYIDEVPSNTMTMHMNLTANAKATSYRVLNGSLAYMDGNKPLELIAEYYNVNTTMDSVGSKTTHGYLLYAGYRIKNFVPYVSYDAIDYQKGEAYFNPNNVKTTILGLRYSFTPLAVVKVEYKYHTYAPTTTNTGIKNSLAVQFAFGF